MPKSETICLRLDTATKEALRAVAKKEYRSVTQMVLYLINEYCQRQEASAGVSSSAKRKKKQS